MTLIYSRGPVTGVGPDCTYIRLPIHIHDKGCGRSWVCSDLSRIRSPLPLVTIFLGISHLGYGSPSSPGCLHWDKTRIIICTPAVYVCMYISPANGQKGASAWKPWRISFSLLITMPITACAESSDAVTLLPWDPAWLIHVDFNSLASEPESPKYPVMSTGKSMEKIAMSGITRLISLTYYGPNKSGL